MRFEEKNHILIAANPKSGSRSRQDLIESLIIRLQDEGWQTTICGQLEDLQNQVTTLDQCGVLRTVIAAGGDGTVSAVASRSAPHIPIAILPLGTENLLAKHIGCTLDLAQLTRSIKQLETLRLDCGTANDRLFLVMVGVGFDAHVVKEMNRVRRGHIQRWSYAAPITRSLWLYRFPKLRITANGVVQQTLDSPLLKEPVIHDHIQWSARWVFVANVPRYAGGLPIANWAACDDGLLDICSFRGGLARSFRYLLYLAANRHRTLSSFRTEAATSLHIESDAPVCYQIDGDYGGMLPVDIKVLPKRLCLVRPDVSNRTEEVLRFSS